MPKIKTRETHKDIKVLDKASVVGERMKNAFIRSKDTAANLADDGQITPEEYAEDRVQFAAEDLAHDAGHTAAKKGKKLAQKGRDAIREYREHPKEPERGSESSAPNYARQEAVRKDSIKQSETRAGGRYQPERPIVSGEGYAGTTLENGTSLLHQPVNDPLSENEAKPVGTSSDYSSMRIPRSRIQQSQTVEAQGEIFPKIKLKSGFEQSAYVEEAPSPSGAMFRAERLLRGRKMSREDGLSPFAGPPDHSPERSSVDGPASMEQPVMKESRDGPPKWDYPSEATKVADESPKAPSDHISARTPVNGKGIIRREKRLPDNETEIKQPMPVERGRQFAIKQAGEKAESVWTEQFHPKSDRMLCDTPDMVSVSSPTATDQQIAGTEPEFARFPIEVKKVDGQKSTTVNETVAPRIKTKTGTPEPVEVPVHADAPSIKMTDLRENLKIEPREVSKATRRRETKSAVKAAEKRIEKTIKQSARSTRKAGIKAAQKTVKSSQKTVKTAEQTAKTAIKTTQATVKAAQKSAQAAAKAAQKAAEAARATARAAAVAAKAAAKAVVAAVKAIIAGVKELVAAIAAGGWVAVVVIVLICLIGLILVSPYGIFFSGNNRDDGAVSASAAVAHVSYDFASQLELLQEGDYDDIVLSGSVADWPEVLAVFAVKVAGSGDADAADVATLDAARIAALMAVFWDMNSISSEVETIDHPDSDPDDEVDDSWTERILQITITAKSAEKMKTQYCFSDKQKTMLDELLENRDALLELIGDLQYISAEAESVVRHLPDDLSDERRRVVKTACSLVGKINYFWGGKSLVIGWDPQWGTIQKVWADGSPTTGTYRPYGLDCSGFVDWVFYNVSEGNYVIGSGGGTDYQHHNCRPISWDEALPGDLVFFPEDSHVGIVAGWDESGELLIIHCSGGGVVITGASGFESIGRPLIFTE